MHALALCALVCAADGSLPKSAPLTMKGDIASHMVAGIDSFLLKQIDKAARERKPLDGRAARDRLGAVLGLRDKRPAFKAPELVGTIDQPALVARGPNYEVHAVRWPAFGDVWAEGLLLTPSKGKAVADIVLVPDADDTPEKMADGPAGKLAEAGCRVLVPVLIDRTFEKRNGRAKMTNREFLYRPAFTMGRSLVGYEVQKVLAGVDWFAKSGDKIAVIGHGEGGMVALFAGALDERIKVTGVSGYFGPRERAWEGPLDRNLFGLLTHFGDAELAAMIQPRGLVIEIGGGPSGDWPSEGGAPAKLRPPEVEAAKREYRRFVKLDDKADAALVESKQALGDKALAAILTRPGVKAQLPVAAKGPEWLRKGDGAKERQQRQVKQIDRHTQQLLAESPYVRQTFMAKLDTSSPEKYKATVEPYRKLFAEEVIGTFNEKLLPPNAKTRVFQETDQYVIHQVVLDVFPEVIAYGLLLVPKGIKPGERRPVVVCQHGLEGRPEDCIGEKQGFAAYKAFAAKLAERGFIVFAPQNPYIFTDRFRALQRKANLIGKTLFSVIVPQHQQITDWLKTLPFVDGARIAFYGLSYGGKSAMRIPPLVSNYCLSICSADFNDWVWKNASTRSPYSYVWTNEYEIFEWDLGHTFNYAEMAALIAPRPFMVERGHFDGVAPDERVALEFAKVRHLYNARLRLPGRAEIEWFVGPHTINGRGTFAFLHRHLNWAEK